MIDLEAIKKRNDQAKQTRDDMNDGDCDCEECAGMWQHVTDIDLLLAEIERLSATVAWDDAFFNTIASRRAQVRKAFE